MKDNYLKLSQGPQLDEETTAFMVAQVKLETEALLNSAKTSDRVKEATIKLMTEKNTESCGFCSHTLLKWGCINLHYQIFFKLKTRLKDFLKVKYKAKDKA